MKVRTGLLALGILYAGIILIFSNPEIYGDEFRYIYYAENLSEGFYTEADDPNLRNGPGYPLLITPFFLLGLPLLAAKLLNAVMLTGVHFFVYETLSRYTKRSWAWVGSLSIGVLFLFTSWIIRLVPATFTLFLMAGFVYFFTRLWRKEGNARINMAAGGLLFGWLALTQFVFSYILILGILTGVAIWFFTRKAVWGQTAILYAIAYALCIPYLIYTYSLTGKKFYWGTNGGEQMYWMTSPVSEELGNWIAMNDVVDELHPDAGTHVDPIHHPVIEEARKLNHIDRNAFFKEKAKANLLAHPVNYLKNWAANIGRFFFMYPRSYKKQTMKTFLYILPNMFILVFGIFSFFIAWRAYRRIPPELWYLLSMFIVYFGGSSLVSASHRYFLVMLPIIIFWLVYVYSNLIRIQILSDISVNQQPSPKKELV